MAEFRFLFKQTVKGKTGEIPFFEAIDHNDPEFSYFRFPHAVRTHNVSVESKQAFNADHNWMVGAKRKELCQKYQASLFKFLSGSSKKQVPVASILELR